MKAEIIAIGSELTCGARLDTNSQWLSRELEALGLTVQRHTTVADDREAMIRVYREAAKRSRVVLITGGLGPTLDDITRDTLAAAFDQPLVQDDQALAHIEALFRSRNRTMSERNKVQALRPANSVSIHNAHGTAPGILMQLQNPDCTIAVMPGVPAEMRHMFYEQVVPELPTSTVVVRRSVIRTFGFGESDAEKLLGDLTARGNNPEVGITASQAVISLSITARAASEDKCDDLSAAVREQICERLGDAVFGKDDEEVHHVVVEQLIAKNLKVAVLEGSTTGGLIGQWFTENESLEHSARMASCQMFPNAEFNGSEEWQSVLRPRALQRLVHGAVDYVLMSSPSKLVDVEGGVRMQQGHVAVIGADFEQSQDVSMTGNLAIFRQRAARTALNLLRLHLKKR